MVECMSNSLSIPIHSRNNIIQYINKQNREVDLNDPQHNISFRVIDPKHNKNKWAIQSIIPSDRSTTHDPLPLHPPPPCPPSSLSHSLSLSTSLSLSLSFYLPLSISLALSFSLSLSFSLPRTPPFRTPPRNKDVSNRAFETHSTHLMFRTARSTHSTHLRCVERAVRYIFTTRRKKQSLELTKLLIFRH